MTATTNLRDPITVGQIPLEHPLDFQVLRATIAVGDRVA